MVHAMVYPMPMRGLLLLYTACCVLAVEEEAQTKIPAAISTAIQLASNNAWEAEKEAAQQEEQQRKAKEEHDQALQKAEAAEEDLRNQKEAARAKAEAKEAQIIDAAKKAEVAADAKTTRDEKSQQVEQATNKFNEAEKATTAADKDLSAARHTRSTEEVPAEEQAVAVALKAKGDAEAEAEEMLAKHGAAIKEADEAKEKARDKAAAARREHLIAEEAATGANFKLQKLQTAVASALARKTAADDKLDVEKRIEERMLRLDAAVREFFSKTNQFTDLMIEWAKNPTKDDQGEEEKPWEVIRKDKSDYNQELMAALGSYKGVLNAYRIIHSYDNTPDHAIYKLILQAKEQIEVNSRATMLLACDPKAELVRKAEKAASPDEKQKAEEFLDQKCGSGLWTLNPPGSFPAAKDPPVACTSYDQEQYCTDTNGRCMWQVPEGSEGATATCVEVPPVDWSTIDPEGETNAATPAQPEGEPAPSEANAAP